MAPRHAIVTGAAGFIGSNLVDRLLAEEWSVTGIDCFTDYYARETKESNLALALANPRFTLVEGDLVDLADDGRLAALMADAPYVFHLAAQAGVRASWGEDFSIYTHHNVLATQKLLEVARAVGVEKVVYASSSSVYGDTDVLPMREDAACWPHSPYGVTKLAAEHLCRLYARNFGVPTVSLRFFTVYGPRQRPDMAFHKFIRAMLAGDSIEIFDDGTQTRDFTYVDDIVGGLLLALDAPDGGVFNLGGGARVTLNEALTVMADAVGARLDVTPGARQAGDVRDTSASLEKSGPVLGYAPTVGLAEGLAAEVAWLRASTDS